MGVALLLFPPLVVFAYPQSLTNLSVVVTAAAATWEGRGVVCEASRCVRLYYEHSFSNVCLDEEEEKRKKAWKKSLCTIEWMGPPPRGVTYQHNSLQRESCDQRKNVYSDQFGDLGDEDVR